MESLFDFAKAHFAKKFILVFRKFHVKLTEHAVKSMALVFQLHLAVRQALKSMALVFQLHLVDLKAVKSKPIVAKLHLCNFCDV